jgi:predicted acetyltransferase
MNINTRHLQGEEMLETLYTLNSYSLHPSPPLQNKDDWMKIVREREGMNCHAVFEDDTPVSVAVSTPMTQNLRGMLFPASGAWGVSTHPSGRRKGYCRQAMAAVLRADRERGMAFSNLYPFRESFYERLGYVSFPLTKIANLPPASLAPTLQMDTGGAIEQKLIGEAYDTYCDYLAEMRIRTHGMTFFDFLDRARANRNLLWAALAKFDGSLEGLMLYNLQGTEVTKYNLVAYRFYYRTSRALYLLLNWVARHLDQADRAEIWLPADEYPELWLADIQVKVESAIRASMCRVVDVEKIGGMGVGEGSFATQIVDPLCPWNEGAWMFESSSGKLQVRKTPKAESQLTVQGLTALIAGTHDPQEFHLRGWGNPSPEIQSAMQKMFPRLSPYVHENF